MLRPLEEIKKDFFSVQQDATLDETVRQATYSILLFEIEKYHHIFRKTETEGESEPADLKLYKMMLDSKRQRAHLWLSEFRN